MKTRSFIKAATLLLMLGSAAPAFALQEKQERPKEGNKVPKRAEPAKPPRQAPQARDEQRRPRQEPQRPPRQQQPQRRAEPQRPRQQQYQRPPELPARPWQPPVRSQERTSRYGREPFRVRRDDQRGVWRQYRAQSWQSEHRTWQQRGGYRGYRIPDYRFRGYFGRDHGFRLFGLPLVILSGNPRFQRGDVWFSLLDPWPEYWPDNWYETDDVYIEYSEDGYYLYNRDRPDVRLAVTVYER